MSKVSYYISEVDNGWSIEIRNYSTGQYKNSVAQSVEQLLQIIKKAAQIHEEKINRPIPAGTGGY